MESPKIIATADLWTAKLTTPYHNAETVQEHMTSYAKETGHTVLGYVHEPTGEVTLLRWPDLRPGYMPPSIEECRRSRDDLAKLLGATSLVLESVPAGFIHCMMGRRVGGYDTEHIAPMQEVFQYVDAGAATEVMMVSARTKEGGGVECYGEPAAAILIPADAEHQIHELGHALMQHHYVIERADEKRTDFYETQWAE